MANNAKFEVEIYGNTAQFENSLKGINTAMSALKSEAGGLRNALRLDPSNTTLMTKLQNNLATQLEQTKNKTAQLKTELAGIDKSTPDGQQKFLKLSKAIQDSETRAGYLERDIKNLDSSISSGSFNLKLKTDEAESSLSRVKTGFGSLKTIAIGALLEIGSKIANTVQGKFGDWIGGAVDTQKAMISLKNTMNFSGNGAEYDALSKRMQKLAQDTNANASDAIKLSTTFVGLGDISEVAGNKVDSLIRANQAFGGTSEDLKSVSQAYGQMSASGKVSAENINQLTDANTALGSALKTEIMKNPALASFHSFAEASEKGAVSVGMLDTAMQTLGKAGGNGTKTMKDSFDSLDETISNALLPSLDAITPIVTGIVDSIANSIPKVIEWFSKLWKIIKTPITGVFDGIMKSIPVVIRWFSDLWDAIGASGSLQILKKAFDSLKETFDILGSALKPVTDSITSFFAGDSKNVGGSIDVISGAFKLLSETIKGISDALKNIAKTLTGVGNESELARTGVVGLTGAFAGFAVASIILSVVNALKGVKSAIETARISMMLLNDVIKANAFVIIVTLIIAVVSALVYFFTQTKMGKEIWKNFTDWLLKTWESIKTFFSGLGTWFGNLWTGISSAFISDWEGVTGFLGGIVDGIKGFFSGLGTWFSELWTGITTIFTNIWTAVTTTVQSVVTSIIAFFQPLIDFFSATFGLIGAVIELAWNLILLGAKLVWDGIVAIFSLAVGFFTPIFSAVGSFVGSVFSAIGSFAQGSWNVIVSVFSEVAGWFGGIFSAVSSVVSSAFSAIGGFASNAWSGITGVFSAVGSWFGGVFNGVSSAVSGVFNAFGGFAQSAWNSITSVFGKVGSWFADIFNGISTTVSNVFGGITRTIEGVTKTISGITDKVKGLLGGSSIVLQREFVDLKAKGLTQNSSAIENRYNNSFTINAGNQDPTAIARAVKREFELGRA